MAKANFVKSARQDIYAQGTRVEYISKKGKLEGQKKSKIDRTIPKDENDKIVIKKGESYYWWQFMHGGKIISKQRPRQSQLTQSDFLSQAYEIGERIEDFTCESKDDFDSFKDELISDLENLRDETQEKLDNMPYQLQEAPTGELLQGRVESVEEWISEIESIECEEYDEDEDETLSEDEISEKKQELISEAISELQGTSYNGE